MYNKAKNAKTAPQILNLFVACEDACAKMFSLVERCTKTDKHYVSSYDC